MTADTLRSLATLLGCILYLMQYPCDPGILPNFANECILWKVHLRFNL